MKRAKLNKEAKMKEDEAQQKQLLNKMQERKDSDEKSVKKFQEECNQEMDAAEKLIAEGNSRLALALLKMDFDDATIASALIDSANKKISSVKKEGGTVAEEDKS